MSNKNVLIISPHPDDMEIGMGGTAAKFVTQEFNVISFVVTDGRRSTGNYSEDETAQIRRREAQNAARILGIEELVLLGLRDVKSTENQKVLRRKLRDITDQFGPSELFITHPKVDKHPTHRAVSKLVMEIMEEMHRDKLLPPLRIWCYEVWTPFWKYDWIEDISGYINVKTAAIDAHKSQIEYKNYTQGIRGLNRYRAVFHNTSGVTEMKYAEVFIEIPLVSG